MGKKDRFYKENTRDRMRKRLGNLIIKEEGKDDIKINVWGNCWKNKDNKFWGGITINIPVSDIDRYFSIMKLVMRRCPTFKMVYKRASNYYATDSYTLNTYALLDTNTLEYAVNMLKNIRGKFKYNTDGNIFTADFEFDIEHDFKYVVDSTILANL